MTIPILVEQGNGKFTASVLGSPQLKADCMTKEQAVAAVTTQLRQRVIAGEVVMVDVPAVVPTRHYTDAEIEVLREITAEIYRERDAQKAAEFPE